MNAHWNEKEQGIYQPCSFLTICSFWFDKPEFDGFPVEKIIVFLFINHLNTLAIRRGRCPHRPDNMICLYPKTPETNLRTFDLLSKCDRFPGRMKASAPTVSVSVNHFVKFRFVFISIMDDFIVQKLLSSIWPSSTYKYKSLNQLRIFICIRVYFLLIYTRPGQRLN